MVIEVRISPQMIATAKAEANFDVGARSFRGGKGTVFGILGEIAVAWYYGVARNNTFEYDMKICGYTVDVKTKDRNVLPKMSYDAHVWHNEDRPRDQQVDVYYFTSSRKPHKNATIEEVSHVYLMGYASSLQFKEQAEFCKKGDTDPTASQRQIESGTGVYLDDCWKMPYHKLIQPSEDRLLHIPK